MKIFKLFFLFSISILSSSLFAQSWLWGRQGIAPNLIDYCAQPTISSSTAGANNSAFFTGGYESSLIVGNDTLSGGSFFLLKYNSSGTLLWAFSSKDSINSSGYGRSVATDKNGNVYITGGFNGTVHLGTKILRSGMGTDLFIVKFDSNGNILWAKEGTEHTNFDFSKGIVVATDEPGNILVAGGISDTVSFGAYTFMNPNPGYLYPILLKYDPNGNVIWGRQGLPSSKAMGEYAIIGSMATDKFDNIYECGEFTDTISFASNTLTTNNDSNINTYLVKYSPSGRVLWAKQSEGSYLISIDGGCVTTDMEGNPYLGGSFLYSAQFGSHSLNTTYSFSNFLTKYDTAGNVLWAKQPISTGWSSYSMVSDGSHIYIGGNNGGSNVPLICGSDTISLEPWIVSADFIMKLDTAGTPICASILNNLAGCSITSDSTGTYHYLAGTFGEYSSDTIFCGPDTLMFSGVLGGGESIFIGRWQECDKETGITPIAIPSENVILYPNPNNGQFAIQLPYLITHASVEVYNVLGEKIYSKIDIQNSILKIDLSYQPNGIYFYRVLKEDGSFVGSGKLIIQK